MKKNFLLGAAEIGAGILMILPFEDAVTAGASTPLTALIGAALAYDGIKRL